jgi:hypothetical protein
MKKLTLGVISLYVGLLSAFSQTVNTDSSQYKSRKLSFEEANFVSSYYRQDGNNSAVTGGIGTEKLSDFANSLEVRLKRYDKKNRKHTWDFELGIDHYTSASSDKIDPNTISSASSADTRIYPSANWSVEDETKGKTFGAGLSGSTEYDYTSFGANVNFAKKTKDKSGELSARLQAYFDQVTLIHPVELRPNPTGSHEDDSYGTSPRNSYSGSLSYSQIVNQQLQLMFIVDAVYQHGYLGLPFHRIFFYNNAEGIENLPGNRFKLPLGIRASYFIGDRFIVRAYYRYYYDDWGLNAHTANIEVPVKITPFFSISPFYRFYAQSAVKYFAPYKAHNPGEQYYTSNYDLSKFNSNFYGAGVRLAPPKGVFNLQRINALELRYGHYNKNIGMQSDVVSLHITFK